MQIDKQFFKKVMQALCLTPNKYHPMVWINGDPKIGANVYIGGFSEIYAKDAVVTIGDNCDIASFVVINCADSHLKTIQKSTEIEKKDITIENNVFIGTHAVILGGTKIGHHSVIAAGVILKNKEVPPFSLVLQNEVKEGYYDNKSNEVLVK